MQLITLSFLLIAVAQASAAATSTYSASASNGVVSSDDNYHYNKFETGTGICTGGTTYCGSFTGNGCPYPLCDTSYERTADIFTCQAGSGQSDKVACADLVEYQCKDTSECKFVPISSNQKKINAVLVAFATISVFMLLIILNVVCRLLPKKETALTQPLLDEENA